VNDYGEMMSPATRSQIEKELKTFEQSDATQVAILTISSLQGETIEDFSMKVAQTWKMGQHLKDKWVLVVAANQDRKIRIEVGKGLEEITRQPYVKSLFWMNYLKLLNEQKRILLNG